MAGAPNPDPKTVGVPKGAPGVDGVPKPPPSGDGVPKGAAGAEGLLNPTEEGYVVYMVYFAE